MTYTAIPAHARRFGRTIRTIAVVDLAMAAMIAVPFISTFVVENVFALDRLLGFNTAAAATPPSFVFALNAAGVMAAVWALGRLISQTPSLVRLDLWRRYAVSALIAYYVVLQDQTPVLLLFVLTEMVAAFVESFAIRRYERTAGG